MTPAQRTVASGDDSVILRERARALAHAVDQDPAPDTLLDVIEFRLAHEHYAVETRFVRDVVALKELTPLPGVPPFVRGIVNVRGQILPLVDLKRLFDLPEHGLTDLHRVIVVRGQGVEIGLLADMSLGVRSVPVGSLQPTLSTLTGIRSDYLKGVTAERLVVLDLDRLLADERLIVNDDVDVPDQHSTGDLNT